MIGFELPSKLDFEKTLKIGLGAGFFFLLHLDRPSGAVQAFVSKMKIAPPQGGLLLVFCFYPKLGLS